MGSLNRTFLFVRSDFENVVPRHVHRRLIVLGIRSGWHADRIAAAADRRSVTCVFADYQSLSATPDRVSVQMASKPDERVSITDRDAVMIRTMPAGNLETTTFRLACLHAMTRSGVRVVNPPAGCELAIDKFATLAVARSTFGEPPKGLAIPETIVTQDRAGAMEAFERLGEDVVVKPIFGGEGRGVMRVNQRELAWTVFSSLQTVGSVAYVQRFIPPGGRDRRVLIAGSRQWVFRRENRTDFRTNRGAGGTFQRVESDVTLIDHSRRLTAAMGLSIAAVDWIFDNDERPYLLEVNAIPGWKSAQSVTDASIAEAMVDAVLGGSSNANGDAA